MSMFQCDALCASIPVPIFPQSSSSVPSVSIRRLPSQLIDERSSPYTGEPVQLKNVTKPTKNDVLLGRGVAMNNWVGNTQFRAFVALNKEMYVTSTKKEKMAISRSIVATVRAMRNPPGRFLEKCPETGLWNDVGDKKAIDKTSQALRDGAAVLRKALSKNMDPPEDGDESDNEEDSSIISMEEKEDDVSIVQSSKKTNNKEDSRSKIKPSKAKPAVVKSTRRGYIASICNSACDPTVSRTERGLSPDANRITSSNVVGNTAVIASHESVEGVLMPHPSDDSRNEEDDGDAWNKSSAFRRIAPKGTESYPGSPEGSGERYYRHHPRHSRQYHYQQRRDYHPYQHPVSPLYHRSPSYRPTSPLSDPEVSERQNKPRQSGRGFSSSRRYESRDPLIRSDSYRGPSSSNYDHSGGHHRRHGSITRSDPGGFGNMYPEEEVLDGERRGDAPGEIYRSESYDVSASSHSRHAHPHYDHPHHAHPHHGFPPPPPPPGYNTHPSQPGGPHYYENYDQMINPISSPPTNSQRHVQPHTPPHWSIPGGPPPPPPPPPPPLSSRLGRTTPQPPPLSLSSSFPVGMHPKPPLSPPTARSEFHSPDRHPGWWGHASHSSYRTAPDGQLYIPTLHHSASADGAASGYEYDYTSRQIQHHHQHIPHDGPYMVSPHSSSHDFAPPLKPTPEVVEVTPQRQHKILLAREGENEAKPDKKTMSSSSLLTGNSSSSYSSSSSSSNNQGKVKSVAASGKQRKNKTPKRASKKKEIDENRMYDSDDGIDEKKFDTPSGIEDADLDDFSCSPLPYDSEENTEKFIDMVDGML